MTFSDIFAAAGAIGNIVLCVEVVKIIWRAPRNAVARLCFCLFAICGCIAMENTIITKQWLASVQQP